MLVHDHFAAFEQEEYEDEETLKGRLKEIERKIAENAVLINGAKKNIERKLELIAAVRAELSELNTYHRRLEGT